ncbi:MAG: GspE/PulE family protein [Gemmatimonadetes bacterium]|nr:GspE/PulE family protein [Gemmatimonadota bacterium]
MTHGPAASAASAGSAGSPSAASRTLGALDALGARDVLSAIAPGELDALSPLTDRLTTAWLEHHRLLPVRIVGASLLAATWGDPKKLDDQALDDLRLLFDVPDITLVIADEAELRHAMRRAYGGERVTAEALIAGLAATAHHATGAAAIDDLVSLANDAPVVRLVNLLLVEALDARASDVHLEQYAGALRVRYRVDGVLHDAPSPPAQYASAIVSRLKIMAELDIAERRVPQDGRIRLPLRDRQVDVRVSIVPTLNGESVVLRLLDRERERHSLSDLGCPPEILDALQHALARPHGIVLATGPTGSGKTTTLYAAIQHLQSGREKILTVEDPVEYELDGVPQVPVNDRLGVSFAVALRALLRQDPDVLMVGEIRDGETAEIAIQAALTGHLVLSTLHTNDAPGALTRLVDLGVAPFLIASTVEAVLAQRLVRRVCGSCAGRGCGDCRQSGYRGRTGLYELLVMTDALRTAVAAGVPTNELAAIARRDGMRDLASHGAALVRSGVTTAEEIARVTRPD